MGHLLKSEDYRKRLQSLFVVAIIVNSAALSGFFLLAIPLHLFSTVFHELGHTITSWLFGYVAIPTFNFLSGRGLTIPLGRPNILIFLVFLFFCYLFYRLFKLNNNGFYLSQLIVGGVYLFFLFAPTFHTNLIVFLGHVGEIIGAFICCYLALSRQNNMTLPKRYIFFVLGTFTFMNLFVFVYKLNFNPVFIEQYINPNELFIDSYENDLVRLRNSTGLSIGFWTASLALLNCLAIYLLPYSLRYPENIFVKWWKDLRRIFPFLPKTKVQRKSNY